VIELPHAVVGATIALKIGNPALSLPLALASHFILDLVPHWNPHLNQEVKKYGKITDSTKAIIISDVAASLAAGTFIATTVLPNTTHFIVIILGAFLAVLPDVAEAPYFFWGSKNKFLTKLIAFQSSLQLNVPVVPGLISQALVLTAAFWWIFNS